MRRYNTANPRSVSIRKRKSIWIPSPDQKYRHKWRNNIGKSAMCSDILRGSPKNYTILLLAGLLLWIYLIICSTAQGFSTFIRKTRNLPNLILTWKQSVVSSNIITQLLPFLNCISIHISSISLYVWEKWQKNRHTLATIRTNWCSQGACNKRQINVTVSEIGTPPNIGTPLPLKYIPPRISYLHSLERFHNTEIYSDHKTHDHNSFLLQILYCQDRWNSHNVLLADEFGLHIWFRTS